MAEINKFLNALAGFLILVAILTLAPGCDNKSEESSEGSKKTQVTELIDETVGESVEIDWWQFWSDPGIKPTIKLMIEEFESQNPNIKVNVTDLTWDNGHDKLVISLAAGAGPDLFELGSDWVPEFAANNRLANLEANLRTRMPDFLGWESASKDGAVFGHPWILGSRVLFYNRDLMIQAGYTDSFPPMALKEFSSLCFKIDSLSPKIYGWGSNAAEKHRLYKKFLPFFWTLGGELFSENNEYCVISSQFGVAALKAYHKLHLGCSMVDTQRRLDDAFLKGTLGVVFSGEWLLKRIYNEKPDLNFVTGVFPGKSFPGTSFMGGEYLVINADSDKKGAALRLLKFITNPENQIRFCKANYSTCPSSIEAAKDSFFTSDPNIQVFVKQLRSAKAPPFEPTWVYIEEQIEKAVERVLFEDVAPEIALHEAREAIQLISRGN
ncbi:MAG: extracellular solute-binding protein [candidate division Zixibacteria bacterium]|nr:extracellular solute-binding protein [candidate division Zixibacteria bacterium]